MFLLYDLLSIESFILASKNQPSDSYNEFFSSGRLAFEKMTDVDYQGETYYTIRNLSLYECQVNRAEPQISRNAFEMFFYSGLVSRRARVHGRVLLVRRQPVEPWPAGNGVSPAKRNPSRQPHSETPQGAQSILHGQNEP